MSYLVVFSEELQVIALIELVPLELGKILREMFYQNFIPYIALQVNDHHELHAIAVRLGMNEYQFAAVLGAVSNNLLTKRCL